MRTLGVELTRLTNQLRDLVYRMRARPAGAVSGGRRALVLGVAAGRAHAGRRNGACRCAGWNGCCAITASGGSTATQVREVLQQPDASTRPRAWWTPSPPTSRLLLPRVELIAAQRREAERHLERLLDALDGEAPPAGDQREHSDVAIVRSMPGIGTRVAARMLAEASQPLVDRAYHVLRAMHGRGAGHETERASSHRLDALCLQWAVARRGVSLGAVGAQRDPASRAYYATLRARGHSHGRALRSVADRLLRILMTLLEPWTTLRSEHMVNSHPLRVAVRA